MNKKSEFAGLSLNCQMEKIEKGIKVFNNHGIDPKVFFAPSHTFDNNTLIAIKEKSNICIISDTIAWDIYYDNGLYFVPQQSGKVRKLPFKITTFCYHPNNMEDYDFNYLETFLSKYNSQFIPFPSGINIKRKRNKIDDFISFCYFIRK